MGEVTDFTAFRHSREVQVLQQQVADLTGLVAGLMAVLCDRDVVDFDQILEIRFAGEHATGQGPMLGQPCDGLAQSAAGYAINYRAGAEGCTPCDEVHAVLEEVVKASKEA